MVYHTIPFLLASMSMFYIICYNVHLINYTILNKAYTLFYEDSTKGAGVPQKDGKGRDQMVNTLYPSLQGYPCGWSKEKKKREGRRGRGRGRALVSEGDENRERLPPGFLH